MYDELSRKLKQMSEKLHDMEEYDAERLIFDAALAILDLEAKNTALSEYQSEGKSVKRGTVVDYAATVDKIKDCVQLCGMKQVEFAKEVGISEQTVSEMFKGDVFVNLDTLVKIADIFEMYLDDLIVRTEVTK